VAVFVQVDGRVPYDRGHAAMSTLLQARIDGAIPDVVLLLEHEPVITVGRARGARDNVLDAGGLPVVAVERGGDVTLHGPGQLVAYPIIALTDGRRDLIRHLRALEDAVLAVLADLGVPGHRDARNSGVWLQNPVGLPQKVAAVGIACRRWVTWHGLALNLGIDAAGFARIHPCGFGADTVTRLADHLDPCPTPAELAPALVPYLARALDIPVAGPVMHVDVVGLEALRAAL
jgi:lipoyl(octanoyl) transferase